MPPQPSHTTIIMGILLAGAWTVLAYGLGSILSGLPGALDRTAASSTVVVDNPWARCMGFQVGSPHAATAHLHLDNGGRERIDVRLNYLDENGLDSPIQGNISALDPGVLSDFMFRRPSLGATVRLVSSAKSLHASVTIHRDDGEPAESRRAFLCYAQ
jgi:hypothetical protein